MNKIYKIYCRIFQGAFHLVLPILPYREPEKLSSLTELAETLKEKNLTQTLIVTDEMLVSLGLLGQLTQSLATQGISYCVYDKTQANPTTSQVAAAVELYHANSCQAIIALGGGSPIDCAKATGARIARPHTSLARMQGILRVHQKLPPLFAIPTTAGTGSETTLAAVITDPETHHKFTICDFPLIPHYAVLDPEMTRSLPPFLTATTGLDALTHAVEVYIGRSTTRYTRWAARKATKLIFANLPLAYAEGDNKKARKNMLQAAYLAGNAFSQSYVGYGHAVAHSLGGAYGTAHGLANAVLLPVLLNIYGETIYKPLYELAILTGLAKKEDEPRIAARRFIAAIQEMNRRFGIGTTIPALQRQDIPKLAKYAAKEANPLYPVPKLMNAKELEEIYLAVLEEA